MNKKNTKKFIKRMINNNITILPCKFTYVIFDNGEFPMFMTRKPFGLGKNMVLKRFKLDKCKGWTMLVAVENIDRNDCLKFGECK